MSSKNKDTQAGKNLQDRKSSDSLVSVGIDCHLNHSNNIRCTKRNRIQVSSFLFSSLTKDKAVLCFPYLFFCASYSQLSSKWSYNFVVSSFGEALLSFTCSEVRFASKDMQRLDSTKQGVFTWNLSSRKCDTTSKKCRKTHKQK